MDAALYDNLFRSARKVGIIHAYRRVSMTPKKISHMHSTLTLVKKNSVKIPYGYVRIKAMWLSSLLKIKKVFYIFDFPPFKILLHETFVLSFFFKI